MGAVLLTGCGTVGLFGSYDLPESEDVATAPWPRLVDVPEAPAPGTYTDAIPDPAQGIATEADLRAAATDAGDRADRVAGPVLSAEQRRRMGLLR
ncbi:MAG: hypothetical protein AAFR17_18120 [Pseudomonadota bacterium]